jgi:hypothetical protein
MKGWCKCLGKELLCIIEGMESSIAYLFTSEGPKYETRFVHVSDPIEPIFGFFNEILIKEHS